MHSRMCVWFWGFFLGGGGGGGSSRNPQNLKSLYELSLFAVHRPLAIVVLGLGLIAVESLTD